jgi:nitroreductase
MYIFWGLVMGLGIMLLQPSGGEAAEAIKLPPPVKTGGMPLVEALKVRRTVRGFASRPLDLGQISQLLWGADGTSDPRGLRTSPSAGATYPLDLYLVVGERGVADLAAGVYHYEVAAHALTPVAPGDARAAVARASRHQSWMTQAPVMVVITGNTTAALAGMGSGASATPTWKSGT